jgi:cytochrome bd-type quinol oxidase subunit 1
MFKLIFVSFMWGAFIAGAILGWHMYPMKNSDRAINALFIGFVITLFFSTVVGAIAGTIFIFFEAFK